MNDREAPAHGHAHDHDHHGFSTLDEMDRRVRALETLHTVKGYLDPAALDRIIETCEREIGPHKGARVVARAWVDPAFRDRLLQDATAAIASLGFSGARVSTWWPSKTRPAGTEDMGEDELAALVTRDAMIGTGLPLSPSAPEASETGERP